MANRDTERAIRRLLDANGLNYRFAKRRKHDSVVVEHGDREITFVFPSTSRSWEGPLNTVCLLRRKLGLRRQRA